MQAFIREGEVEAGYIAAVPRLCDAVRFRYRPMRHAERSIIQDEVEKAKGGQASRVKAKALAEFITEWDVKDQSGEVVEISAANVARLRPPLFDALFAICEGRIPSDPDPELLESDASREDGESEGLDLAKLLKG